MIGGGTESRRGLRVLCDFVLTASLQTVLLLLSAAAIGFADLLFAVRAVLNLQPGQSRYHAGTDVKAASWRQLASRHRRCPVA